MLLSRRVQSRKEILDMITARGTAQRELHERAAAIRDRMFDRSVVVRGVGSRRCVGRRAGKVEDPSSPVSVLAAPERGRETHGPTRAMLNEAAPYTM